MFLWFSIATCRSSLCCVNHWAVPRRKVIHFERSFWSTRRFPFGTFFRCWNYGNMDVDCAWKISGNETTHFLSFHLFLWLCDVVLFPCVPCARLPRGCNNCNLLVWFRSIKVTELRCNNCLFAGLITAHGVRSQGFAEQWRLSECSYRKSLT